MNDSYLKMVHSGTDSTKIQYSLSPFYFYSNAESRMLRSHRVGITSKIVSNKTFSKIDEL